MIGFDGMGRIVDHGTTPTQDQLLKICERFEPDEFKFMAHSPSDSMKQAALGLLRNGYAKGSINGMRLTPKGKMRTAYLRRKS